MAHRNSEDGHDSVADHSLDGSSVVVDDCPNLVEAAIERIARRLGIERLAQSRRSDEVHHEDGHRAARNRSRRTGLGGRLGRFMTSIRARPALSGTSAGRPFIDREIERFVMPKDRSLYRFELGPGLHAEVAIEDFSSLVVSRERI